MIAIILQLMDSLHFSYSEDVEKRFEFMVGKLSRLMVMIMTKLEKPLKKQKMKRKTIHYHL